MSWDVIFFYLIAAVSIVTALGVVAARNPVHSAIFLVLCFVNIAGIFVMLGAEFLAVIQIIVYTGAVLVLVLFVVMLVDPEDLPSFHTSAPLQRYVSILLGVVLLLAADLLSQRLPLNANMPIGLTTGLLGGLYLLWLLSRSRRI